MTPEEHARLTIDEARARVAKGAAHLDQVWPRWEWSVDTGTLTLASICRCVVGQLCGDFDMRLIGLKRSSDARDITTLSDGVTHGFDLSLDEVAVQSREAAYRLFQDAWVAAIADRRLAQSIELVAPPAAVGAE